MAASTSSSSEHHLASRILQELERTDARNNGDAHFICRLMFNITEILSSENEYPKQANNLLSKSDFAEKLIQSKRFLELIAIHIGGDLDGWGAASTLIFTSIQALNLCLTTTTPADGRCKAAFLFYVQAASLSQNNSNNESETFASKVLYRLLTIMSSCPNSLVQQMSSGDGNTSDSSSSAFALQIEGEILAWKNSWECIIGFIQAIGATEGRKFLQKKSEDIARQKALRQSAAVYVAYLRKEESNRKNYKLLLNSAKEFVEES